MFTGVKFEKAIESWKEGKKVIVLDRNSKFLESESGYDAFDFEELFRGLDFLVDVPESVEVPEDIKAELPEPAESITPPHSSTQDNAGEEGRLLDNKPKKELIKELVEQGLSNQEISDKTGIPCGTVGYYACQYRGNKKDKTSANVDRHLCRTCQYRSSDSKHGCNYLLIEGHSRGCSVDECTVYVRGKKLEIKKDVHKE